MLEVGGRGGDGPHGGRVEGPAGGREERDATDSAPELEAGRADVLMRNEVADEMQKEPEYHRSGTRTHDRTSGGPGRNVK
jgi:hypothetical protein